MMRYLLDTGVASDFIYGRGGVRAKARERSRLGNPVGVGIPVVAELLAGAENSSLAPVNEVTCHAGIKADNAS